MGAAASRNEAQYKMEHAMERDTDGGQGREARYSSSQLPPTMPGRCSEGHECLHCWHMHTCMCVCEGACSAPLPIPSHLDAGGQLLRMGPPLRLPPPQRCRELIYESKEHGGHVLS
jgi:hypothetical protein